MNIGVCKVGKSIKFKSENYTPTGGDIDAPNYIRLLANHNPDKTFYIIGKSDLASIKKENRSKLFDYDNIVNIWENSANSLRALPGEETSINGQPLKRISEWTVNWFNTRNIKLDYVIIIDGAIACASIPLKIKLTDGSNSIAKILEMNLLYASHIFEFLNQNQNIPFIEICNDPRYFLRRARDIIPSPKAILTQFNGSLVKNSIRSYEDQSIKSETLKHYYAAMEMIFLYGRDRPAELNTLKRTTSFAIVLNQGRPDRYPMLKEWILDKIQDVNIIGQWDKKYTESDKRFVGTMQLDDVQIYMNSVRSSFIIPIKKGWVTSKYIEMIHAGVIPFFHPTYDTQNNLKMPDWIRPKNTSDLLKRIDENMDDSVYLSRISELRNIFCKEKYYDGSFLNRVIFRSLIENYKEPDLSKFEKIEKENDLSMFF